jgi:hypothetical protein
MVLFVYCRTNDDCGIFLVVPFLLVDQARRENRSGEEKSQWRDLSNAKGSVDSLRIMSQTCSRSDEQHVLLTVALATMNERLLRM